jgi:hypothetical protein
LSITPGIAGRLLSDRTPCPWTGVENVDGRAVEAVAAVPVGAAVIVEAAAVVDVDPEPTTTASNVEDESFTPTRGEEDPPTLTPSNGAAVDVVTTALLAFEEIATTTLLALEETATTTLLALEEATTTTLLALEDATAAALLVFEVTAATALLVLIVAAALLVFTALLVVARASIGSATGAAATNAPKSVKVARSFILMDLL